MRDFTPLPSEKETRKNTKPPAARRHAPRKIAGSEKSEGFGEDEEEFLLEEYESDGEDGTRREAGKRAHCGGSSESEEDGEEELEEEEEVTPKVHFTSRMHSQVAALAVCRGAQEDGVRAFAGRLRTVCLGSRKNVCVNKGEGINRLTLFSLFFGWELG